MKIVKKVLNESLKWKDVRREGTLQLGWSFTPRASHGVKINQVYKRNLWYPLGTGLVSQEKKQHERDLIVLYQRTMKYSRSFLEVFMKIENVRTQSRAKQCTHFAKEIFCCTA